MEIIKSPYFWIIALTIGIFVCGNMGNQQTIRMIEANANRSKRMNTSGYRLPDLGVTPPPKNIKRINIQRDRFKKDDCLTSEELLQNIEDAEMKGMGDDAATFEAFKDELK